MLDHGLPKGAEHPAAVLFVAGANARGLEELLEHGRRAGHALLRDKSRRALRRDDQRRAPAGLVQGRRLNAIGRTSHSPGRLTSAFPPRI